MPLCSPALSSTSLSPPCHPLPKQPDSKGWQQRSMSQIVWACWRLPVCLLSVFITASSSVWMLPTGSREILLPAQWSSKETRTLSANLRGREPHLGQGLQHQGHLGCIPILLVGLSLELHSLSLCFAHCLNDCCLCLSDFANLLSFCLCQQDLLHPEGAQVMQIS